MEKLVVVSKGTPMVNYERNLGMFDYEIVESLKGDGGLKCDLLIIELRDRMEVVVESNILRKNNPSIPILIISTYKGEFSEEDMVKIEGYGQVRVLAVRNPLTGKLVEVATQLLSPEQATEGFRIAFVIPIYNEEERFIHVRNFTKKLGKFLDETFKNSKIYFVNDGSKDKTKELINDLQNELRETNDYVNDTSFINLRNLKVNTRKAGTYIEGIFMTEEEILIFVDGDDSFFEDDIARMINILKEGYYDMVLATKDETAEGRPPIRRLMSFCKRLLTRALLPKGVYDAQTGLKAMKGDVARYILPYLKQDRKLAIDLEMVHIAKKLNFRALQLPVKCIDRDGSHVDIIRDSISYLKNIWSIFMDNRGVRK